MLWFRERTALKAKIRNLEAEIESLQSSNRSLGRENTKSRLIINTFIKNDDLNDNLWGLLEELGSNINDHPHDYDYNLDEGKSQPKSQIGFKRKEVIDIGHQHHRTISQLEVETNAIMSSILQEENRQMLIINDFQRLLSEYPQFSGEGHWANGKYIQGPARPVETADVGVQADMKDENGVVEDIVDNQPVYEELLTALASLPPPPKSHQGLVIETKINGVEYPYYIRHQMTSYPRVLRIPPIVWTCETIMAIYGYMIVNESRDLIRFHSMDHRDMHSFSLQSIAYRYFHDTQSLQSNANMLLAQFLRACEYHYKSSKRVHLFVDQLGMFEKDHSYGTTKYDARDTRMIIQIIDKCYNDHSLRPVTENIPHPGPVVRTASQLSTISEHDKFHIYTLSRAVSRAGSRASSRASSPRLPNRGTAPPSPTSTYTAKQNKRPTTNGTPATMMIPGNLRPDINRVLAVNVTQVIFSKLLPNSGLDLLIRANSLPATTITQDCVNIDDLIELLLEAWRSVRAVYEEHARYLFHMYCGTYRIVSEVQFASDTIVHGQIALDQDSVVVQVPKNMVTDLPRRPLRILHKASSSSSSHDDNSSSELNGNANNGSLLSLKSPKAKEYRKSQSYNPANNNNTNPKKDSVCDLLSKNNFHEIMKLVRPDLRMDVVDKYFSEGLEQSHRQVLKSLDSLWMKQYDDQDSGSIRRDDIDAHAAATVAAIMIKTRSSDEDSNRRSSRAEREPSLGGNPESYRDVPIRKATYRHYYVNLDNGISQWTPPYRKRTFYNRDLEIDNFVSLCLFYDVFMNSSLRQAVQTMPPKEVWTNTEAHIKSPENNVYHILSHNNSMLFPAIVEQEQDVDSFSFISQEDVKSIASRLRRRSSCELSSSKLPMNILTNSINNLLLESENETKAKKSKKKKSKKTSLAKLEPLPKPSKS
jgi:hypothetical protein